MNTNVIIKHCPDCETIVQLAGEAQDALGRTLGVVAGLRDGAKGEFTVLVNGTPAIEETAETLPTIDEILAAVRQGTPEAVAA
jgi:predicted Rdx family selenoprotein